MSQFVLVAVIFFAKRDTFKLNFSEPILGDNSLIVIIFAILAVALLIASFILKNRFLSMAIEKQNVSLVQTAVIVACALCEAVSLFGVVLATVFNYQYFFIFPAVGILGMIFHFPKRENTHLASYNKSI